MQSKGKKTIQQAIEHALKRILQQKVSLFSSGRTDAGVHAKAQVANFKTNSVIKTSSLQKSLNSLLPKDISIVKVENVSLDFNSRFCTKSKVYRYTILNRKYPSALLRNTSYFCSYPLDLRLIIRESKVLVGKHDFKSFQATDKIEKGSVRTIKSIKLKKNGDIIYIDIEANGFLKNMARNIIGTLIEVGRGKLPPGSVKKILLAKDRRRAGPTIEAKGLCLLRVFY